MLPGQRLIPGQIRARAADSRAGLRLDDGSTIDVHGPELHMDFAHRQWTIHAGRISVNAAGDLLIGWHQGSVRLHAGDAIELTVRTHGATVAVRTGSPLMKDLAGTRQQLEAGATRAWSATP